MKQTTNRKYRLVKVVDEKARLFGIMNPLYVRQLMEAGLTEVLDPDPKEFTCKIKHIDELLALAKKHFNLRGDSKRQPLKT